MMLANRLQHDKPAILERWFQLVFDSYPADTSAFLKREKDRFRNPVGSTIVQDLGKLFDEILQGFDAEKIAPLIEYFIKIRSVQDFTPSQAVTFVIHLKRAVRDHLADDIREGRICEELLRFESRLDDLALLAFEHYTNCREKIYELRTRQIKAGSFKLMERMNRSPGKEKNRKDRKHGET